MFSTKILTVFNVDGQKCFPSNIILPNPNSCVYWALQLGPPSDLCWIKTNISNPTFVKFNHRYPFYMLACIDTEWKLLTWLRYTIWMPLYPLGVLAEGMCICRLVPITRTNHDSLFMRWRERTAFLMLSYVVISCGGYPVHPNLWRNQSPQYSSA